MYFRFTVGGVGVMRSEFGEWCMADRLRFTLRLKPTYRKQLHGWRQKENKVEVWAEESDKCAPRDCRRQRDGVSLRWLHRASQHDAHDKRRDMSTMIKRNTSTKPEKETVTPTTLKTKKKPIDPRTLKEKRRHIAKSRFRRGDQTSLLVRRLRRKKRYNSEMQKIKYITPGRTYKYIQAYILTVYIYIYIYIIFFLYMHTEEPGWRSRYSDWLLLGRPRCRSSSPGRVKNFLFSTSSGPALEPTQPPITWVPA
jgi:hypothetical protein